MGLSCIAVRGSLEDPAVQSKIYSDLYQITKDDKLASLVWVLSQDSTFLKEHKLSLIKDSDPKVVYSKMDFIENLMNAQQKADFYNYMNSRYDKAFNKHSEALEEALNLQKQESKVDFSITQQDNKFLVLAKPVTAENELKKDQALQELNNKLISFIEKLGFTVREVDNLDTPGLFSAKNAEKNAEGLIEAILIAKNKKGKQALPEEISHLLVAGLQNNPLIQRLKQVLTPEVVREVLGDMFEQYNEQCQGDQYKLQEEALGRLIAQHLVDRAGLSSNIQYISNRVLDLIQNKLQKGNESEIHKMLEEAVQYSSRLVDSLGTEEFVNDFNSDFVINANVLYNLDKKVKKLSETLQNSYEVLSKRIKILSLTTEQEEQAGDIETIRTLRKAIREKDYALGYTAFIERVLEDCKSKFDQIEKLKEEFSDPQKLENKSEKTKLLKKATSLLNDIRIFIDAYKSSIKTMTTISNMDKDYQEIDELDTYNIQEVAVEAMQLLNSIEDTYSNLRKSTLIEFYRQFWKKDIKVKNSKGEDYEITLEDILESQLGDTTGFDRLVGSVGDSKDPLLQMAYDAYHKTCVSRDSEITKYEQRILQIYQRYYDKTGSKDTSFIYAKDKEGNYTGMFLSNYDWEAFRKAKNDKIKELKNSGLSEEIFQFQLDIWEEQQMGWETPFPGGKACRVPINFKSNALDNLNEAQLEFYRSMITVKAELNNMIPRGQYSVFRAPQKKKNSKDLMLEGNIKGTVKRLKEEYVTIDSNDTDYGELEFKDGKYVLLNFNGEEVKKVPCYYTTFLDDMSMLDTNASDAMISFAAMAINYKHMSKLAETMELTNSLQQDRDIKQFSGVKKLYQRYRVDGEVIESDYTIKGSKSEVGKQLRYFIDANIYGRRKKLEEVSFNLGGKERTINYGQLGDNAKSYSTIIGMGASVFSATTNITMGESQLFREACAGQYFGLKDLLWAKLQYFKLRPKNAINAYSKPPTDKLSLLLRRFNCLGDVEQNLKDTNYNNGLLRRISDKFNLLLGNMLGEHYLKSVGMLAILKGKKVLLEGKEMSLWDALDVETKKGSKISEAVANSKGEVLMNNTKYDYTSIQFKGKVTDLDGNPITMADIGSEINEANRYMHGGFNQEDKGQIHETTIGRNLMNFRQWMPAVYTSRFGQRKINTRTGEFNEGAYRTSLQFLLGTVTDLAQFKFNILSRYKNLNNHEKANIMRTLFDVSLLVLLTVITNSFGDDDEENDPGVVNLLKYNMYRLKMEIGAMLPSLQFKDSITTLIQSPLPAMESINNIFGLLDFTLLGEEVGRGRYKGWSKWAKQAYLSVPGSKNITRFVDMLSGDTSMFRPYTK